MGGIRFPHLGISIPSVGKSIDVFGFSVAYYGIVIACAMVAGYFVARRQAQRLGEDGEFVLDLAMWDIVFAILGARIYYVVFSWEYYSAHPAEIINIRGGGMAIYGGVIGGVIATYLFSRVKKLSFLHLTDIACCGLLVGQIIGRWGNFFNREAFGDYTDGLLAMQIPREDVRSSLDLTSEHLRHIVTVDGVEYIQVHPTFLYESLWNVGLLLVILLYTRHRKFNGQLFLMYLFGYGLGRVWIEGLRTDQLKWMGTQIAVSQILSGALVVVSGTVLFCQWWGRRRDNLETT